MAYQDETEAQALTLSNRDHARREPRSASDWDAETHVMPIEYCQLLKEISRQLK